MLARNIGTIVYPVTWETAKIYVGLEAGLVVIINNYMPFIPRQSGRD